MPRLPFRRCGAALVVATVAVVLVPAPSQAVEAGDRSSGPRLSPSRYPSVQAVARIFPDYRGGTRELLGGRQLSLAGADCRTVDVAGTQPRAGGVATYFARGGDDPFFSGDTSVVVALYDFRRPKRAQAALDEERDTVQGCYGPNFDEDGYGATFSSLAAPELADDRFAYRYISHDANTGDDFFVQVYFRRGRFLGAAFLQRDRSAPSAAAAFRLARAAVRSAS